MFLKLRNKIIAIIMLVSTSMLIVAFSAIYFSAASRTMAPHPMPEMFGKMEAPSEDMKPPEEKDGSMAKMFEDEIRKERSEHMKNLLISLTLVGVSTEILIFILAIILSEKIILPVKQAYDSQREFIANASHELKTPIAAVQANFEALGATEQPWVNNIETELNRANNLVKDLLTLARTDGRQKSELKEVDVVSLVKRRVKLVKARLGEKELSLELPDTKTMKLVSSDFLQIFDILLDNAVKYSDKKIEIALDGNTLSVKNDGKIIPKEKCERVFDRFYQVDKTAEGSGLGLSIAKTVAEKNKWKLIAESDNEFTSFKITLS